MGTLISLQRSPAGRAQLVPLALALPALLVFVSPFLQVSADGQLHLYRLLELDQLVRQGIFYSRWWPDLAYGYGLPLLNYYAPLAYYLTEPLILVGFALPAALNLSLGLALACGAVGMFVWLRDEIPEPAGEWQSIATLRGAVAAAAFVYAPYVLFNAIERASLGEAWALGLAPWAMQAWARLSREGRRGNLARAIVMPAAALASHNATGLLLAPLLALYGLGLTLEARSGAQRRKLVWLLAAAGLGALGLTAFFWLPALFEQGYIQIGRVIVTPDFDFRYHLVSPGELLAGLPPGDPARLNPVWPATLGLPQVLLGLAGASYVVLAGRQDWRRHTGMLALMLGGLGLVLLMLPPAEPVWERIPALQFLQLPARLRGLAAVALAPFAGAALYWVPSRARTGFAVVAIGTVTLFSFPLLFPRADRAAPQQPTLQTMYEYEQQTGAIGTTSFGEYLPVWATALQARPAAEPLSLPEGARMLQSRAKAIGLEARLALARESRVVYRTLYFPGWEARVDGQRVEILPTAREGLISFNAAAGEHSIEVEFRGTALEQVASVISVLAAMILAGWVWRGRLANRQRRAAHAAAALETPLPIAPFWLLGTGLAALWFASGQVDTPWVTHFEREGLPQQLASPVRFGESLALLRADVPPEQRVHGGEMVGVTLYWQVQRRLARNQAAAVHLEDVRGSLVAQSDHLHPGQLPTSRWDPQGFVVDQHLLQVPQSIAPGIYSLTARVYDPATGVREGVGWSGTEAGGDGYLLGRVIVP